MLWSQPYVVGTVPVNAEQTEAHSGLVICQESHTSSGKGRCRTLSLCLLYLFKAPSLEGWDLGVPIGLSLGFPLDTRTAHIGALTELA